LVERLHDYLERSFLPGRRFTSPQDFNSQLAGFLARANSRQHRVLGCRPVDRVDADRQAMLELPLLPPVTGWRQLLRLPRDHYVRLDGADYSVHPAAIGRRVVVSVDLDRVRVSCDGTLVADHDRVWAKHQTISDPAHLAAAKALRRGRIDLVRPPVQTEVDPFIGRIRHRAGDRYRRRRADGVMAATKSVTANRDLASELVFLTRVLKAPTLRDSAARLAERARAESWSHEEYLAACLQREVVAARDAHGGESRIRAARFPARKSIEEFDFDHARGLKRDLIAHLATLDFVAGKENVIFLGPPGTQ
jgi:hypothetical protein